MSHITGNDNPSGPTTQNGGADDILYTSNATSGHFLGTVPRAWMLGVRAGREPPTVTNQDSMQSRPRTQLRLDTLSNTSSSSQHMTAAQTQGETYATASDGFGQRYPADMLASTMPAQPALTRPPHYYDDIVYPSGQPFSSAWSAERNAASLNPFTTSHDMLNSDPAIVYSNSNFTSRGHMPHASVRWTAPQTFNGQAGISPVTRTVSSAIWAPNNDIALSPFTFTGDQTSIAARRPSQQELGFMTIPASGNRPSAQSTTFDEFMVIDEVLGSGATLDTNLWGPPSIAPARDSASIHSPSDPAFAGANHFPHGPTTSSMGPQTSIPDRLSRFDYLIARVTATKTLNSADIVRIAWLRSACRENDMFYLMLHQLACIHNSYPHFITSNLMFQESHAQGLVLFNWIMNDARQVTTEIMNIFCNFVRPFGTFAGDASAQVWISRVKIFLGEFTTRWTELRVKVFDRGCPPSAREIVRELGAKNPVLGKVLFAHFFYQLFPQSDSVFSQWCFGLFLDGQLSLLNGMQVRSYDEDLEVFQNTFRNFTGLRNQHPQTTFHPSGISLNQASLSTSSPTMQMVHMPYQAGSSRIQPTDLVLDTATNRPTPNLAWSPPNNTRVAPEITSPITAAGEHPIFPAPGYGMTITVNPDPSCLALHQAHLRSPTLQVEDRPNASRDEIRFYSFLECHIGLPQIVSNDTVFETWTILVPADVLERKAKDEPPPEDNPFGKTNRIVCNDSVMFHLRCIQVSDANQNLDAAVCSAAITYWPTNLFISINEMDIEFRRKAHHGKDLPVDVTHLIHEPSVELQLSYYPANNESGKYFAIVLEAIKVLGHDAALQLPGSVDAQTSLASIVAPLQIGIDDDDIVMVDNHISIDLIDPFTARMFDSPVRGATCRHRECFDLESYLRSRSCRNKDDVVHPDEWKCPICGKDARPSSLIVDQFMLQVKEKLIADSKVDTRAILVNTDGSWEPKETAPEVSNNNLDNDTVILQQIESPPPATEVETATQTATPVQTIKSSTIEPLIYEIDDDDD